MIKNLCFIPFARGMDGNRIDKSLLSILDNRLKNISDKPITVKEVVYLEGDPGVPGGCTFYGEGYHMLTQYTNKNGFFETVGAYGDDASFYHLPKDVNADGFDTVYYLLRYDMENLSRLYAFTSCEHFMGKFRIKEGYMEAVLDTEGRTLLPGQSVPLEEFEVFEGEKNEVMLKLSDAIAKHHPKMKWESIPVGWCSYYCMGKVTPQALYDNAEAMAKNAPFLQMIQVDAGTNTMDGDWMTPRFSDDLPAICQKIRDKGVLAGGYLAPFIVHKDSELAKNHPEWMVQENGKPTSDYSHNPNWYILDGSHPGAVEYLRKIIRWMRDDCGLRYFKLDFLAYGALPVGERYDKNMSAVESYRAGMRAMIEEAGEDSFILACNSPFWPTLGLCHGQRVTNDILRQWKLVSGNARELFYRNWQHQNLWINDPDCVVLERIDITRSNGRVRECTLTDAEFEFHKAFALCCGGMILSGDLLDSISEKSVDILKRLTDNMGEAAFFDSDDFAVGRFKEKPFICLFNWSGEEREVSANIPGKKSAYDFFTDEYIAEFTDTITLTLPPHGARSLFIKPAN